MDDTMSIEMSDHSHPSRWRLLAGGGFRAILLNLLVLAAFGVLVPWMRGLDAFDPLVVFAYTSIALLYAAASAVDLAASDAASSLTTIIAVSVIRGWTILLTILALSIATVNVTVRPPRLLHPDWTLIIASAVFALAGAGLLASLGVLLTTRFSRAAARTALRVLFLVILCTIVFGLRSLPREWQAAVEQQLTTEGLTRIGFAGAAISLAAGGALLLSLRRRS